MHALNLSLVPDALHAASALMERITPASSCVREVPGLVGWSVHPGVRQASEPLRSHVCATSYDHLRMDVPPDRASHLYQDYPQQSTFISLAGSPGTLSPEEAVALLGQWGVSSQLDATLPAIAPDEVYAARPIFLLHQSGRARSPVAVVACRYEITHLGATRLTVDAYLDAVGVTPAVRSRGLAHLALLEASRWLGMLTRSLLLSDRTPVTLRQRVHSVPSDGLGFHLAQCFLSNYAYFTVTEELLENTRLERAAGLLTSGELRAGLAVIAGHVGVEDMIHIPDDSFSFIAGDHAVDDDDHPVLEVVIDNAMEYPQ